MENLTLIYLFLLTTIRRGFLRRGGGKKNKEVVFGIYMYCYKLKLGMISLGKVRL